MWGEADALANRREWAFPTARRRRLSITPLGVLDEERENTFRRWYPVFRPEGPQAKEAAWPPGNFPLSISSWFPSRPIDDVGVV
jgi:hypothetical protein